MPNRVFYAIGFVSRLHYGPVWIKRVWSGLKCILGIEREISSYYTSIHLIPPQSTPIQNYPNKPYRISIRRSVNSFLYRNAHAVLSCTSCKDQTCIYTILLILWLVYILDKLFSSRAATPEESVNQLLTHLDPPCFFLLAKLVCFPVARQMTQRRWGAGISLFLGCVSVQWRYRTGWDKTIF
jgi:hypothetical protein